ncbi:MAG: aldo/keto reductase [Acidobacteriota bacterium]|nr:aldo/keto reductase [Acidobacteriota bacterium]
MNEETQQGRRSFLKAGGAIAAGLLAPAAAPASARAESTAGQSTNTMPTRNLGRTGHRVGIFSLGGQAALEKPHNEDVAVPLIERALDLGVNYCDTSSIYGGPERWSEQYFGKVMKHRRADTFLATKTKERTREGSMRMIERSLELLQTDHVDLWQLHDIGTLDDVNQCFAKGGAMEALIAMKEQGVVKNLGLTGHHRPAALMEGIRRFPFDTILMALNAADPHQHSFAAELLPLAVERRMGIIGMKVPARGRILSSWTPPTLAAQQHSWEGQAVLSTGPGTLQMREAMYYTLTHPVSTVIIGCDSIAQLEENIALAREFTPLSSQQMAALHEKTAPVAKQSLFFRNFDRPDV